MKEFIQEIIKTSMKDAYGFFIENVSLRTYYPNPKSEEIVDFDSHF